MDPMLCVAIDGSYEHLFPSFFSPCSQTAPELSYLCIITPSDPEGAADTGDKISMVAHCSEAAQQRGLRANEWVSAALDSVGGKSGGKAGMAQGSAVADAQAAALLAAAARQFHQRVLA